MTKNKTQKNILDGWSKSRLDNVCDIVMGQSPSSDAYNNNRIGLPLVQGNNDIKKGKTIDRVFTSEITKSSEKGSIILTVRAPVGDIGISHRKICLGRGVCSINAKKAEQGFILYFLKYYKLKWRSLEQGSTFTAVNSSDIRGLKLSLPPLPEQTAIVSILETWDTYLEKLTQKIQIKKTIKKGLMQKLLSGNVRLSGFSDEWKRVKLGDLGKCLRGVSYNPRHDLLEDDVKSSYRLLRSNNVKDSAININSIQIVVGERVKSAQILQCRDMLICMANGSKRLVGKSAIFRSDDEYDYTFGAFMGVYRINDDVSSDLVVKLFETDRYRFYISSLLSGSSINNLKPSDTESMFFLFPTSSKEQTAIAKILTTADQEIEELEKKKKIIEAQKKYLLNNLVTGHVRIPEFVK